MKKFIGLWITAAILLCLGISLTVAGAASGATQIIKNSGGLIDKIADFMESNIIKHEQPVDITDTAGIDEEIQRLNIYLEGFAISLKPTNKDDISIKYTNPNAGDINILNDNGIITIKGVNTYNHLNNLPVEIFVPIKFSPEVIIESEHSAVSVEDLTLDSLTCNTTNAAISVEDVHCAANLTLTTLDALINVESVYADNISINSDIGIVNFDSLLFNQLNITNVTGAINGELESRSLYTVTTTNNGTTNTVGTGARVVNITNDTGFINIEYDN